MKTKLQRIHWHSKQPIFSMDWDPLQPTNLVTAGGDNAIRLWSWSKSEPKYSGTLSKHIKSVNCIRFSPSGFLMASAGDGGLLVVWERIPSSIASASFDTLSDVPPPTPSSSSSLLLPTSPSTPSSTESPRTANIVWGQDDEDDNDDESGAAASWRAKATIRASDLEDIYDISWSPCSTMILIGLTNNTGQVWQVESPKLIKSLKDHTHFVQGVAWDPLGTFLVTCSSDKTVKVWTLDSRHAVCRLGRLASIPASDYKFGASGDDGRSLFNDEGVVSFFRRLSFSKDGSTLLVPGGLFSVKKDEEKVEEINNCMYVWTRLQLNQAMLCCSAEDLGRQPAPSSVFWGWDRAVLGIRFSPLFYRELNIAYNGCGGGDSIYGSKYTNSTEIPTTTGGFRMIYAIFSIDSVVIYDNRSPLPIATLKDLHYGTITDVAWSADATYLTISSTDGFLTLVEWEEGELGVPVGAQESSSYMLGLIEKQSAWYEEVKKIRKNPKFLKSGGLVCCNGRDGDGDGDGDDNVIEDNVSGGENISEIQTNLSLTKMTTTPATTSSNEKLNKITKPESAKRRITPTLIN